MGNTITAIESSSLRAAVRHKFEGIFFMHEVDVGSHELAAAFLGQLRENRPFAMDFWGLVDSVGRFHEKFSDGDLRDIVVSCVCGEWIPKDDPFFAELEQEFRAHRSASERDAPARADIHENRGMIADVDEIGREIPGRPSAQFEEAASKQYVDDPSPVSSQSETAEWPRPVGGEAVERDGSMLAFPQILAASDERDRRRIDSAISKLELNSVAMRLYLDSIDSRMNRLEPHVEELATQVVKSSWTASSAGGQVAHPLTDDDSIALARHFGPSAPSGGSADKSAYIRQPLKEDRPPEEAVAAETEEIAAEPATGDEAPLTETAVPERKRRQPSEAAVQALKSGVSTGMAVAGLLILVCGLLGIGIWRNGGSIENRATTSIVAPGSAAGTPTGAAVPSDPGQTVITGETTSKNSPTSVASTSLWSRSVNGPRSNNSADSVSKDTATTAVAGSASAVATRASAPAISTTTGARDALSDNGATRGRESTSAAGKTRMDSSLSMNGSGNGRGNGLRQVRVSSGVMATNLVRSSPPEYPVLARLTRQQGPVVMQVFISNRGTVDHVNVVKGHHILRGAAVSAVRSWKYRPYYVNGRPVEVATMVTVDFKLGR
ncbi:hypothetical protein BH10ACI4_BH10ACI4_12570 [soil metagenome]